MPLRSFHSKIAGVSHRNPNGTDRQRLIARLRIGEELELVAERNQHDPNAMALHRQRGFFGFAGGEQLGYLPADVARRLADDIRSGAIDRVGTIAVYISDLTGGTRDKPTRGVNIEITISAN